MPTLILLVLGSALLPVTCHAWMCPRTSIVWAFSSIRGGDSRFFSERATSFRAAASSHAAVSSYADEVISWLESESVPWRDAPWAADDGDAAVLYADGAPRVLLLGADASSEREEERKRRRPSLALRLVPSPHCLEDAACDAVASARLTDACAAAPDDDDDDDTASKLPWPREFVHLHEDVWRARSEIARARLLARVVGGGATRAVAARKTRAAPLDHQKARAFLEEHHLWGATRVKHC